MTARDWKPGDVALALYDEDSGPLVYLRRRVLPAGREEWASEEGTTSRSFDLAKWHRPLLVIDPESDADVERLWATFFEGIDTLAIDNLHASWGRDSLRGSLHAALRSMLTPPKPEEPTGLGAVVEDADGVQWLRCFGDAGFYVWRKSDGFDNSRFQWSEVHAVRTLSAGFTDAD